jgi:prevent-host-death family protein
MYRIHARPGQSMAIAASDVIPLSQARANLSELADEVKAGAEKIITKNGESYVALIDAARLDYYHRLEEERVHLVLLDDIEKGLADIDAGRTQDAREVLLELRRIEKARAPRRSASRPSKSKSTSR